MNSTNTQENTFPDRTQIKKSNNYVDNIIEELKLVDLDKIDESNYTEFKLRTDIIEEQRVYFWIRMYLNNEIELTPNTDLSIEYLPSGEKLTTKFICYAKEGSNKDVEDQVANYNPVDNKKILCLMVDSNKIDKDSADIPFIRTLFKIGRFYEAQILRNTDLLITDSSGNKLEFYDIDF